MKPNKKIFVYIFILSLLALILYAHILKNYEVVNIKDILFWGLLAVVVESLLIVLPNSEVGISVGSAVNIASILIGGPLLGATIAILGFLFRVTNASGKKYVHLFNTPFHVTLFNVSQGAIVSSIMGLLYVKNGGIVGEFHLFPTILILLMGMIINTVIISALVSIINNQGFANIWISNIKGTFFSSIAVGTLGIIIALAFLGYGYGAVLLFFGPLLLARHSFKLYIDMRNLYISTIEALNKTIEAKDRYTSGHANRVEEYSVKLAESYGLSYERIQNIRTAAMLHDIGKIGINDSILHKTSKLSHKEYAEIRKHSSIGADIISKMDFLQDVANIIRYHHERYDGKGYPEGLKGKHVPVEAYVLAIADAYDAMTSDRPYRRALKKEFALKEIEENAGTQFHPSLAKRFVLLMNN